jgi:hypothetical protein
MLGGQKPALTNFKLLGMQAAYFAANDRMSMARVLADQALKFASLAPEFRNGMESVADRDLKALLTTIQSVTEAPSHRVKKYGSVRSKFFKLQASAVGLVLSIVLVILVSIQRTNSATVPHRAHSAFGGSSTETVHASANGSIPSTPNQPDWDAIAKKYGATISDKPPDSNQVYDAVPIRPARYSSVDEVPSTRSTGRGALDRLADDMIAASKQRRSRASVGRLTAGNEMGNTPAATKEPLGQSVFSEPAEPLPQTGILTMTQPSQRYADTAPLKIVTAPASPNYYAKLVDWTSNTPVALFFIRSGEVLSIRVPLGDYALRFASGEIWYGEQFRFGPDTAYQKADAHIQFRREGDKVVGHRLELIKQIGGNLRQVAIRPVDF